jgi:phage tail-like protein
MADVELPALIVDDVRGDAAPERLVVINRHPAPGERDVPLDTSIALDVVDTGTDGIDAASTRVWVNDVLAYEARRVLPGWDGSGAAVLDTADTLRIVLAPSVPFASEARVVVRVEAFTRSRTRTLDSSYEFFAEDRTAPRVVAAQAIAPRLVRIGFDEPVRVVDGRGFELAPLDAPAVPLVALGATADDTVVTLELNTPMTPDARYEVRVRGVTDRSGNAPMPPHDRVAFAGFRPPRPERRRFDLWSMLPKYNRREDATGDLRRFIACLQEVTDLILGELDRFPDTFDVERAPAPFLDLILRDLGNPFAFELDATQKRRLAASLVEMYRQKGTAVGIRNAVRFFVGVEITAVVAFAGTTLVLGEAELGVDWVLGPSERFARYAFDVHVDRVLTDVERAHVRGLIERIRPAHTHFVSLIEPHAPEALDHWLLGVSELGSASDLH